MGPHRQRVPHLGLKACPPVLQKLCRHLVTKIPILMRVEAQIEYPFDAGLLIHRVFPNMRVVAMIDQTMKGMLREKADIEVMV